MESYQFNAWVVFGKLDTGETEVWVDLTEEEIARLEKLRKTPYDERDSFDSCEYVSDIYQKVYDAAVEQITCELRENSDPGEYEEDWKADDTYMVNVDVPWVDEDDED